MAIRFLAGELSAAVARGVRQLVVLGSRPLLRDAGVAGAGAGLEVIAVHEEQGLAAALEESSFDHTKASLFVWLGDAGFRSLEAVVSGLAFIGSLPAGSGIVVDYVAERCGMRTIARTALDSLASRFSLGDRVSYCIQPQAVAAMLGALGFREIADIADDDLGLGGRLVTALV